MRRVDQETQPAREMRFSGLLSCQVIHVICPDASRPSAHLDLAFQHSRRPRPVASFPRSGDRLGRGKEIKHSLGATSTGKVKNTSMCTLNLPFKIKYPVEIFYIIFSSDVILLTFSLRPCRILPSFSFHPLSMHHNNNRLSSLGKPTVS